MSTVTAAPEQDLSTPKEVVLYTWPWAGHVLDNKAVVEVA